MENDAIRDDLVAAERTYEQAQRRFKTGLDVVAGYSDSLFWDGAPDFELSRFFAVWGL